MYVRNNLVFNRQDPPSPSRGIYGPAFQSIATKSGGQMGLRENDYVFGDLKVGMLDEVASPV